jgi:hypothetical protein
VTLQSWSNHKHSSVDENQLGMVQTRPTVHSNPGVSILAIASLAVEPDKSNGPYMKGTLNFARTVQS